MQITSIKIKDTKLTDIEDLKDQPLNLGAVLPKISQAESFPAIDFDVAESLGIKTDTKSSAGEISFSDTNADGVMTSSEWVAAQPEKADLFESLIKHFDADGDGALNSSEFAAAQMMKSIRDQFVTEGGSFDFKSYAEFMESHEGITVQSTLTSEQVSALYAELFLSDDAV